MLMLSYIPGMHTTAFVKIINLEGKAFLDFGCGTSLLTERMAPQASRILALDSSERMISVFQ